MITINIIAIIILAIISFMAFILPIITKNKIEKQYEYLYIIVLNTTDNKITDAVRRYFKTREDAIVYAYNKNYKNYYISVIKREV